VGTNAEIAVLNSSGKLVMESIIETKANTILEFVHGLRGSLYLTFEEGTWAAWLYVAFQIMWHTSVLIIWRTDCGSGVKRCVDASRGNMKLRALAATTIAVRCHQPARLSGAQTQDRCH
jgi:hypothetical protein